MFRVRPFPDGRGSQGCRRLPPFYRSIPPAASRQEGGVPSSFMGPVPITPKGLRLGELPGV